MITEPSALAVTPASPTPPPPAADEPELLDRPGVGYARTARALDGLSRVNRLLIGYRSVLRTMLPCLAAGPARQILVDLGTGSGEGTARLARAAARRGIALRVIGIDRKLSHLVIGRHRGHPQTRVVADAAALPFRDGACDWAASSLFFHHFDATGNRCVLAEMLRVARRGVAVVDLRRNRLAYALARLLIPLLGVCPITRHDGAVSASRSWTLPALRRLTADLPVVELRRRFPFRFSLVLTAGRVPSSGA